MPEAVPETPWAILRALWSLLGAHERRALLRLQLLSLLMAASTLVGIAAIFPFFTLLADPGQTLRPGLMHDVYSLCGFTSPDRFLVFLGCGFVAMVILANAVNFFGALALHRFALRLGRDFYVQLFSEYLQRDYLFHARRGAVELFNNITYEAARVVTGIVQGGLTLVANLCSCVVIAASVVWLSPRIAGAAVLLLGGSYALIYLLARRRLARNGVLEGQLWDSRARTLTEGFGAVREILLAGSQQHFREKFARDCDALASVGLSTFGISQSPRYALECILAAGLVGLALWMGGVRGDPQWLAALSFLAFAAYRLLPALQQAFAALARLRADRAAFLRILDDLRSARGADGGAPPAVAGGGRDFANQPRQQIRARQVTFRYAPRDEPAVRDVSLEIPAGATVGFVGANGAGKSTMADLLLGLLAPETGTIEIDGIALSEANRTAWRANVASVPQSIYLLDASLAENIAFGTAREAIDTVRMRAAVAGAGLESLVASRPEGLWQPLGERGIRLSGGQRQRVGIARALYRHRTLLVLDEATAALDGAAERDFADTLSALHGHATVIAITHRTSSARCCDWIYEFGNGTIVHSGDFQSLVHSSARFRSLAGADA